MEKDTESTQGNDRVLIAPEPVSILPRSADIYMQAGLAGLIVVAATLAATVPHEPTVSGDALIGLYSITLGYLFGYVPGAVARRNGHHK